MAVYTEVTDSELIAFLQNYDIGPLLSFKGIAEGVENSNFLLHTQAGFFILTLYEKRVHAEDLPFFIGLMDHLAARGINCPMPVRAKTGEALGELAGRPAAIVTFLDGLSLSSPNADHCEMLGEALAQMHLAGEGFDIHRDNALSLHAWRPLYGQCGSRVDTIEPGLGALMEHELDFLEQNWPQQLPQGIIHADLFPDNAFFLQDRFAGIIDFYFSCNDILAYDVAVCINAWCFEDDFSYNQQKAEKLLKGYQGIRKFNQEEINSLPILIRGAAIRFLLTRVYDWINVPENAIVTPKTPIEYIKKLKFHQSTTNFHIYGIANKQ
jgi:homoserine kinase type II